MAGSDATTVSAYDLLPEDEREALAWVREHGGLGAVEKRLMPEGMEWLLEVWPKWSNGEYCRFGDWWKAERYGDYKPMQLRRLVIYTPELLDEWEQGDGESYGYEWDFMRPSELDYRPDKVEPPAPKVLDADGVEIRAGDTVYGFAGQQYEVAGLCEHEPSIVHAKTVGDGVAADELLALSGQLDSAQLEASKLTHRAPVLAADDLPLREGEHVWHVETGTELVVKELPKPGEYQAVVVFAPPASHLTSFDPDQLTHQRPVLAADGKPLEAGQTVYAKNYGYVKCTVLAIEWVVDGYLAEVENEGGHKFRQTPDQLTHERPVLDADGVPIHVGETVYKLEDSRPYTVKRIDGDHVYINAGGKAFDIWTFPGKLTHEQPDDWSRWREDLELPPVEYADRYRVGRFGHEELDTYRDLVRRARKLAERSA